MKEQIKAVLLLVVVYFMFVALLVMSGLAWEHGLKLETFCFGFMALYVLGVSCIAPCYMLDNNFTSWERLLVTFCLSSGCLGVVTILLEMFGKESILKWVFSVVVSLILILGIYAAKNGLYLPKVEQNKYQETPYSLVFVRGIVNAVVGAVAILSLLQSSVAPEFMGEFTPAILLASGLFFSISLLLVGEAPYERTLLLVSVVASICGWTIMSFENVMSLAFGDKRGFLLIIAVIWILGMWAYSRSNQKHSSCR